MVIRGVSWMALLQTTSTKDAKGFRVQNKLSYYFILKNLRFLVSLSHTIMCFKNSNANQKIPAPSH